MQLHCLFTHDTNNKKICPSFPEVHYDVVSNYKNDRGIHICAIVVNNVQVMFLIFGLFDPYLF